MTTLGVSVIERAAKLDVITEELIIEDGCDKELDDNRQTIQDIRMTHKNAQNSSDSKSVSGGSGTSEQKKKGTLSKQNPDSFAKDDEKFI